MPYKYRQLDSHASAKKPKPNRKPKADDIEWDSDYKKQSKKSRNVFGPESPFSNEERRQLAKEFGSKNKVKNAYKQNVKTPGRAQPKGTQPKGMASPPRTGPNSGGGGQSARYNRLTGGGLNKHGR